MDVRLITAKHREEAQFIDVYKYHQRALSAITTLSESCRASIVARTWVASWRTPGECRFFLVCRLPVKKTARRRKSSCSSQSLGISYPQMATSRECEVCRALAQEIRDAYADLWAFSDQAVRDAWLATHKMIGGTEEDAQRAEDLLKALPQTERYDTRIPQGFSRVNPKLREAFQR